MQLKPVAMAMWLKPVAMAMTTHECFSAICRKTCFPMPLVLLKWLNGCSPFVPPLPFVAEKGFVCVFFVAVCLCKIRLQSAFKQLPQRGFDWGCEICIGCWWSLIDPSWSTCVSWQPYILLPNEVSMLPGGLRPSQVDEHAYFLSLSSLSILYSPLPFFLSLLPLPPSLLSFSPSPSCSTFSHPLFIFLIIVFHQFPPLLLSPSSLLPFFPPFLFPSPSSPFFSLPYSLFLFFSPSFLSLFLLPSSLSLLPSFPSLFSLIPFPPHRRKCW